MKLVNIEKDVRKMIKDHLATGVNLNRFCKEVGLHYSQVFVFLNHEEKGLTTKAVIKIAKYFENKKTVKP